MLYKRKKPRFHRQYSQTSIAIGNNPRWRKPKGIYSNQQMGKRSRGKMPTPGYGQPRKIRGLHPSGMEDILVKNEKDLEKVTDVKKQAIRLSATLGLKKRTVIIKKAEDRKIRILNKGYKLEKKKKVKKVKTEEKKPETKKEAEKPKAIEKKPAVKTEMKK